MTKSKKLPRYKQIMALGDISNLTAAEIADRLDLCQTDVTVAIYHAEKYHGITIPYRKIYGGDKRAGAERKSKPPVAAKKAPQGKDSGEGGKEPKWPERCKQCKYCRPVSSNYTKSPLCCHYCHDTGHTRGRPLKQVVPVADKCDKWEPK